MLIGGKKTDITLKPNKNTFRTIMIIKDNVLAGFRTPYSIRTALGFDAVVYEIVNISVNILYI